MKFDQVLNIMGEEDYLFIIWIFCVSYFVSEKNNSIKIAQSNIV